jgi:transposase-like protein
MPWYTKSQADERFTDFIKQWTHTLYTKRLQESAAALLSKRIRLLGTEANQQTILLFVLMYILHYI